MNIKDRLIALKKVEAHIKKKILSCEQSLLNQHRIEIEETLSGREEPYGSITIGDITFKIPKYIKWDDEKLEEIALGLDKPRDYIDVKYSVSESKYKALPLELKELFEQARTVTSGKVNISL